MTCAFVPGIGQHPHGLQERPQHTQGHSPGSRPGHAHCPAVHRRPTAGSRTGRTRPGCSRRNHGSPPSATSRSSSPCGSWFSPGTGRRPRSCRPGSGTARPRPAPAPAAPAAPDAGRQHLDHLIEITVRGGLRQPEAAAQPRDVAFVPEPGQGEDRLLITAQPAGSLPRADLAAARGQQPGNEKISSLGTSSMTA